MNMLPKRDQTRQSVLSAAEVGANMEIERIVFLNDASINSDGATSSTGCSGPSAYTSPGVGVRGLARE